MNTRLHQKAFITKYKTIYFLHFFSFENKMSTAILHCIWKEQNENKILKEITLFDLYTGTTKIWQVCSPLKNTKEIHGLKYIDVPAILHKATNKFKFLYAVDANVCKDISNILNDTNRHVYNLEMFNIPKINELLKGCDNESNCYTVANKIGEWCAKNNYKINLMNNDARLQTFSDFTHKFIKKNMLSEYGFVKIDMLNNDSYIKCIFCDLMIHTWCINDSGMNLHKKYNTNCFLFNNYKSNYFNDM